MMPNRILYTALLKSKKYNAINPAARDFYIRILLLADDFGRYNADPVMLAREAYPVCEDVTSKHIRPLLGALADVGLVVLYEANGDEYLEITNWAQRTRSSTSKYPAPANVRRTPVICQTNDGHMSDTRPSSAHVFGDVFVYGDGDDIEKSNDFSCDEPSNEGYAAGTKNDPVVYEMPTKAGKTTGVHQSAVDRWRKAYPNLDVMLQLERAKTWLLDNPARGKTPNGMTRFIGSWLSRAEQDRISGRNDTRQSAMERLASRPVGPGWDEVEENE